MSNKTTSTLDAKGRVLIPQQIRDALNMKPDEKVVIELDTKSRCVLVSPAHEKRLLRLEILLADCPGSLAKAAGALAALGVDLVSTHSHSSRRGERAIWEVECNPGKAGAPEIRKALAKSGAELKEAKWE